MIWRLQPPTMGARTSTRWVSDCGSGLGFVSRWDMKPLLSFDIDSEKGKITGLAALALLPFHLVAWFTCRRDGISGILWDSGMSERCSMQGRILWKGEDHVVFLFPRLCEPQRIREPPPRHGAPTHRAPPLDRLMRRPGWVSHGSLDRKRVSSLSLD